MSTKLESRQSTPSVIARLMGLDELTPQQPVKKQKRVLSENYLHRVASIGVWEKRSSHKQRSFSSSVEDQEDFEHVYAVQETLKRKKHYKVSVEKMKAKPSSPEPKMAFESQKVMDVDSMSVDMDVETLKKAHDLSEADLRKDHFQSYLQKPSSLISKHLCDLQGVSLNMQSRYIPLNSSASSQCGKSDICVKTGWRIDSGNLKMHQKPEHAPIKGSQGEDSPDIINSVPRYQDESKIGSFSRRSRIVVLKPTAERSECVPRGSSLLHTYPDSCSGDWKNKELYAEKQNPDSYLTKKLADEIKFIKQMDSLSSETTKHFPRSTEHGTSNNFKNTPSERNTIKESKSLIVSFPYLSHMKNGYQASFCNSDGLCLDKEAKKNISERWKTTQGCQEVGLATGSKLKTRTLGEMLALPDNGMRLGSSHFKLGGKSNNFYTEDRSMNSGTSLCISSRDGRKDVCFRNLTVGSPSTYSTGIMSPKAGINQRTVKTQESVIQAQPKLRKFSFRKFQYVPGLHSENVQSVRGNHVFQNELKNESKGKHSSGQNSVLSISSSDSVICCGSENTSTRSVTPVKMTTNMVAVTESEVMGRYFGNHKEQQLASMDITPLVEDDASSYHSPEASDQQDLLSRISDEGSVSSNFSSTDSESSSKLEEAYQPSPVSVLVPPFEDEISVGSECFQGVNLDGVKWRLEILKSESSETFSEGSGMIVSSDDEDIGETSTWDSECKEHKCVIKLSEVESRDFSYIIEVLTEAGFNDGNQGFHKWHSLECPINPRVFENLEKKYGEQTSWKRSERRLLFDRINLGLLELLRPCMGMSTWTKPVSRRLKRGLKVIDELGMLLANSEKQAKANTSMNALEGRGNSWLELGDEIEIIGREIENSLIDELTAEVVSSESF
ncbi:uncharacterized protein LOC110824186 isoform X1 [Carica papaya]|uniref:uncharacterized protein LOC110824186 isoform X1 n=1 Tax=Carica papaya TaxID=3649 RepID=UPI000B8CCC2F|nr:uncharacterized protein LOC110824186 isoform X1 [Carica papaya]XP_021910447.1 uncharacterized protein LOC110824186 isoform X1 [Carica papaya]XP_021910448.1 uncharacterized protein LOC110824186 isoform X1 [Carica papaya]